MKIQLKKYFFCKLQIGLIGVVLIFLLGSCKEGTNAITVSKKPNIILLLADDLGYGDLGCFKGDAFTPNLDGLANDGIKFTNFYAAAPNCSPSRTGLLTGRSPSKVGVYNYIPPVHTMYLRAEEITIAEILKGEGYRTGHFGKWHLSNLDSTEMKQPSPFDQGFDYSLGTTNNAQPSHLNPKNFVRNGERLGVVEGYSCDIVVDEALKWVGSKKADPFFMYIAFHEPHKIVASPPALVANYPTFPQKDAEYLANVENMDAAIGRLLDSLSIRGLNENTLIVFASDNGSYRNGSNGPLLGGKSFVYEGGIRVPGIIHWKGQIKEGITINTPVGLIDLMPTICEIVNVDHPKPELLAGENIVPVFNGNNFKREIPLSWFFYRTSPEIAMRIDNYSILGKSRDTIKVTHQFSKPDMDHIRSLQLDEFEVYDLNVDISQEEKIDYRSLDNGEEYKGMIIRQLSDIQREGYYWDTLPPVKGAKKLKSNWRQLRPTGFSN